MKNKQLIYSILFLRGKTPTTLSELSSFTKIPLDKLKKEIEEIQNDLKKSWQPTILKIHGNSIKLAINEEISKELSIIFEKNNDIKLSKPLLEVLTIIAYKQPTTKPEIEKIRGVSCDVIIKKLIDLELIVETGRANTPGMPFLYSTTDLFLETFNLKNLSELPELKESLENTMEISGDLFNNE